MSIPEIEVFPTKAYAAEVADRIAGALDGCSSVVLTGGRTAKLVYPELAAKGVDWSRLDVFFSDERCVPPDHAESNFKMACDLLLGDTRPKSIQRVRGEDDPGAAAIAYDEAVSRVGGGFDLVLLGLGGDCHIAGIFPNGPVVAEGVRRCVAVERPDGLEGITLTPVSILGARKIVVITHGEGKAGPVVRALDEGEDPASCPARLLATHTNVTFLIDEPASSAL